MYQKRKGTDSSHGTDYEKEMVSFFAVQCLASGLKDFAICSNVAGLGAWDDAVLYTETESAEKRLHFVQLKHKFNPADKTSLLSNKEFEKYRTDYDAIVENKLPSGPKSFVSSFKVKQKHMRFIFYTNTDTNNILKEINKLNYGGNIQTSNESDLMNLATNSNVDIYQLPPDGQFEKQFYLFTAQTTVLNNEIKTIVKNVMDCFNVTYLGYEDFHLKLMKEVIEWIGNGRILRKSDMENMISELTMKRFDISPNSKRAKLFWKTFALTRVENCGGFTFNKELYEMGHDFAVNFHGNRISFSSFVETASCENIVKALTVQDIVQLITEELKIGTELDIPKYYINRISPRLFCSPSIFQENADNFAIVASPDDFEKYKQQEKLNINCDKLQIVRNSNEIKFANNFHILQLHQLKRLKLELLHSNTENVASISKHVYSERHVTKNLADELTLNYVKKMLVLADPGMGKSIFLKHLHNTLTHHRWPMFIVLNAVDYDKINNFSSLAEWYRERLTSDLNKTVFDIYKAKGAVFALFDGYDEVHQDDVDSLNSIISDAVASNITVLVSSRHSRREQLVDLLQIHPNTLEPFDESNKRDFLENYFTSFYPEHENLVQTFVQKLLACHSFSKWSDSFSGIPLQLYMLAECFAEDCKTYSETEQFNVSQSLTIIDLYERFIDKMLDRYLKEKLQLEKAALKRLRNNEKERFLVGHRNAALQLLFPQLNAKESDEETEDTLQYGLIAAYNRKGVPEFIHRTFAEYLAADWFFRNKDKAEGQKVLDLLLDEDNGVVLDIFDRMACNECRLHLYVLDNDIESVKKDKNEDADARKCGRNSLHLIACRARDIYVFKNDRAISYDARLEMVEFLLGNYKHWKNEPDKIFKKTPLEMAWNRKGLAITQAFLKRKLVDSIPPEYVKDDWKALLEKCACNNYDALARTIMQTLKLNAKNVNRIRNESGNSLLHLAAMYTSMDVIKVLKPYFPTLDICNKYKKTPLYAACQAARLASIEWLVDNGADLFCDEYSCFRAALQNTNEDVRFYITDWRNLRKWFPNEDRDALLPFECGNSLGKGNPLHVACLVNNMNAIKQLIEVEGANANAPSSTGYTPIFWTLEGGNCKEALKYLLANAASVRVHPENGHSCLIRAANRNVELLEILIEHEPTAININSFQYGTALDDAQRERNDKAIAVLRKWGAKTTVDIYRSSRDWYDSNEINRKLPGTFGDRSRGKALHWACALNDAELLETLLAHPCIDAECRDSKRQTAIFWALEANARDALRYLLSNAVHVRMNPYDPRACLMYAIDNDNTELLEFTLEHAPNMVSIIGFERGTALDYAVQCNRTEAIALLKEKGAKTTMDLYKASNDWYDPNDINKVLPGRFDDLNRGTALHWACALNNVELIKTLLTHHKNVRVESEANYGQTPIFWAIKGRSLDAIRLLLLHNTVAYSHRNTWNETCIYYAVSEQNLEVIQCLLNHDQKKARHLLNKKCSFNKTTCLDRAVSLGNEEVINVLKKHGAKTLDELKRERKRSVPYSLIPSCVLA